MSTINEKIKEVRKNLELSQKQFAEAINKSVATVKNYESGRTVPGEDVIAKISEIANVSKDWITGAAGDVAVGAVKAMEDAGAAAKKVEEAVKPVADAAAATEIEVKKNTRKAVRKAKEAAEEIARQIIPTFTIESRLGGQITIEEIMKRLPAGVSQVYIKPEENKAYWVKGDEAGEIILW